MLGYRGPQMNSYNQAPSNQNSSENTTDKQGCTREMIIKLTKTYNQEIIDSIQLIDGIWFVENMPADKWIEIYNDLDSASHYTDH